MRTLSIVIIVALSILGCRQEQVETVQPVAEAASNSVATEIPITFNALSFDDLVEAYENVNREDWQRPEQVLDYLGNVEGKTIADIGAGSGYFSYRLLQRGANVIATDIDPRFIKWLDDHVLLFDEEMQSRFETRLASPSDNTLREDEIDGAILINTISYIPNRLDYLKKLARNLKSGSTLMLVDYKTKRIPVPAPDYLERSVLGFVEHDLEEAGYKNIRVDECSLDFQWIIVATRE